MLQMLASLAIMGNVIAKQAPIEHGTIHWRRNFELAQAEASRLDKPLLIVFQEVPGCETCKRFGTGPLSEPTIKKVAESLFVPLLIHNNTTGDDDERTLKLFGETSWNNPVMRGFDAEGQELVPRLAADWSVRAVARLLVDCLRARRVEVPEALRQLAG